LTSAVRAGHHVEETVPPACAEGLSILDPGRRWHSGAHLLETVPSVLYVLTRPGDDPQGAIAGFYTLGTAQADSSDLPPELGRQLPPRNLPVAVLAWLGVSENRHGEGLGSRLLAQALRDCYDAGRTFAVIAVILDCIDENAKDFYQRWDFRLLPGHANRLFLSWRELEAMVTDG
jgi:GNAT superfamily N-acetyltransferase